MRAIRSGWLRMAIGGLLTWLLTVLTPSSDGPISIMLVVAPLILIISALATLTHILKENPLNIASPIGAFCGSVLVYFGFGGLVPALADYATVEALKVAYEYSPAEALAAHGISGLGIGTTALGVFTVLGFVKRGNLIAGEEVDVPYFQRAVLVFFFLGAAVTMLVTIPATLKLIPAPPNALAQLGRMLTFSVLLMGFGLARGILPRPVFVPFFITGVSILMGGAVLSLSKHDMFFQAAASAGGFFLHRPSRRVIVIGGLSAAVALLILTPLLVAARTLNATGGGDVASRVEAGRATLEVGREILEAEDAPNLALVRIQYVNMISWARNEYDSGRAAKTATENALWLLVPRAVWPDKPQVSSMGQMVTDMVSDVNIESATGLTVWGEGYWNGGTLGVVLVSVIISVIIAGLSILSFDALRRMDVAGTTFVYSGAILGFRIDGWLFPDFVGQIVLILGTYCLLWLLLAVATIGVTAAAPISTTEGAAA